MPQSRFGPVSRRKRRGVVLLVVLALLTLFAAVGIAFVWFADQEAASAAAPEQFRVGSTEGLFAHADAVAV